MVDTLADEIERVGEPPTDPRHVVVKITKGNLTKNTQLYIGSIAGKPYYRGEFPYYDGSRVLVNELGYQLDDLITFLNVDGSRTQPRPINDFYWTQVRETDRGGLSRRAWRGAHQDAISWFHGSTKDAV